MALFHLSVTQTKRSAGQSAIASAAYRAGERLYSEYYGEYSDYTRKGGVICSDILLPSHAPPEYAYQSLHDIGQHLPSVMESQTVVYIRYIRDIDCQSPHGAVICRINTVDHLFAGPKIRKT